MIKIYKYPYLTFIFPIFTINFIINNYLFLKTKKFLNIWIKNGTRSIHSDNPCLIILGDLRRRKLKSGEQEHLSRHDGQNEEISWYVAAKTQESLKKDWLTESPDVV